MNRFLTNSGTKFGVIVGISTILGFSSATLIPNNHIGHEHFLGKINEKQLAEGLHFVNPFSSIIKIPLTTVKNSNKINVTTKEGLELSISIDVLNNINSDLARDLYIKYRGKGDEILVDPTIKSTVRDVISKYEAKALYNDVYRTEITNKISEILIKKLQPAGVNIQDILINSINLPHTLTNAIKDKMTAEQEKEKVEFTLDKERQRLKFDIEKEENEAKILEIRGNGIKKFQDIVSKDISDKLLKWKGIEATENLAKSSNTKIVIIGNESTSGLPLIFNSDK